MVETLINSRCSFFDSTPIGNLLNYFSNDLGILDSSLPFSVFYMLEGPIVLLVAVGNMSLINFYIAIPAFIFVFIAFVFFFKTREAMIKTQELDLRMKNDIFQFFGETAIGVTQVRVYNQKIPRLQRFTEIVDRSTKTNFGN